MPFIHKDWRNADSSTGGGDTSTPVDAAGLEDLEDRLAAYAESLTGAPSVESTMLYGFADDEDNHQDFYADALATNCNSARIGVGYNAPGSAASLAAVAAYEADPQIEQVVVYLWSTTVISASTWATQAALACSYYPNALIEILNEPNLNSFGGYTYEQAAAIIVAVVDACPTGRIIGPAVSQIGEGLGGDYVAYQAFMYAVAFIDIDPADLAGVAFHLYPTTGDPVTELESHVATCYGHGEETAPVFITELGYQYGIYSVYQPWASANAFTTYYHDERVGGIFYYRLAPQQPTPLEGETFQQYPMTTNAALETALTDAFTSPPITSESSAIDLIGGSFFYTTIFSAESFLFDDMTSSFANSVGSLISDETNTRIRMAVTGEGMPLNVDHQSASAQLPLHPPSVFPFEAGDYAMAIGGELRLRIKVVIMCNATDPACDFTVNLYAADSAGGGDTIGTATSGSSLGSVTVANADLTASNPAMETSAAFDAPADGALMFTVIPSTTPASGFAGTVHCYLQLAHIL